jgi:hypothetical protein
MQQACSGLLYSKHTPLQMKGAACYTFWTEGRLLSKQLSAIEQHLDETMTAIKQHFLTSLQA